MPDVWALAGVRAGAAALAAAGEDRAALDVAALADGLAARLGPVEGGAALVARRPLGLLPADDPAVRAAVAAAVARVGDGPVPAAGGATGLSPAATLRLAHVELDAGDPRALARLRWLLEAASPTWAWPTVVHPRTGGGAGGDGHDSGGRRRVHHVACSTCSCARATTASCCAACCPTGGPAPPSRCTTSPSPPAASPTPCGGTATAPPCSGSSTPATRARPVRLTAPGLDPSWVGEGARGEALLAPHRLPVPSPTPDPDPGDEPAGAAVAGRARPGSAAPDPERADLVPLRADRRARPGQGGSLRVAPAARPRPPRLAWKRGPTADLHDTPMAVTCAGSGSATGGSRPSTGSTSTSPPARRSASSAPTAPGSPPRSRSCARWPPPPRASARVAGYDVVRQRGDVRRNIGLVFQDTTLDLYLSAEQNLRFHAELYGVPRAALAPALAPGAGDGGPVGAAHGPGAPTSRAA